MRLDMTIYINTRIWESPNFNRLRQSFCEPIIGWGQRGWRDATCIYRSFVSKKCQELKMKFCEENGTISFHTVPYMVRYENHNRNSMVISLVCLLPTHCKSINLSVVVLWLCSIASPIIFFFFVCVKDCLWWNIPLQISLVKLSPATLTRSCIPSQNIWH